MVAARENDDVPFSVIGSWGRLDSGNLVQQFSDVGNTLANGLLWALRDQATRRPISSPAVGVLIWVYNPSLCDKIHRCVNNTVNLQIRVYKITFTNEWQFLSYLLEDVLTALDIASVC